MNLIVHHAHLLYHRFAGITRWVEHFDQPLNRLLGRPVDLLPTPASYGINCAPPSLESIADVIHRLKSGEATGKDEIPRITGPLHTLIQLIWETEKYPSDWYIPTLLPLLKTGDKIVCGIYRGIPPLDAAAKNSPSLYWIASLNRYMHALGLSGRLLPEQWLYRPSYYPATPTQIPTSHRRMLHQLSPCIRFSRSRGTVEDNAWGWCSSRLACLIESFCSPSKTCSGLLWRVFSVRTEI